MKLMQFTFIGKLKEGYVTYHKNGILTDDVLSNIGVIRREELGRLTGTRNDCQIPVVKIDSSGEIVEFYKSVREAGRKNHMSYQTILDRINGKVKSLYAPDGYVYVKDKDSAVQKVIRKIELENQKEFCVARVKENIQGVHTCYICGESIQPIDEEFVETKRDTKIWVHRGCVPKGRKDNGKCN